MTRIRPGAFLFCFAAAALAGCDRTPQDPSPPSPPASASVPADESLAQRILWGLAAAPAEDDLAARDAELEGPPSVLFVDYARIRGQSGLESALRIGVRAADLASPLGLQANDIECAWLLEVHQAGTPLATASVVRVTNVLKLQESLESASSKGNFTREEGAGSPVFVPRKGNYAVAIARERVIRARTVKIARWIQEVIGGKRRSMADEPDIRAEAEAVEAGTLTWFASRGQGHGRLALISENTRLATSCQTSTRRFGSLTFADSATAARAELPLRLQFFESGPGASLSLEGVRIHVQMPLKSLEPAATLPPAPDFGNRFLWGAGWCPHPGLKGRIRCVMIDLAAMRKDQSGNWPGPGQKLPDAVTQPGFPIEKAQGTWEFFENGEAQSSVSLVVLDSTADPFGLVRSWEEAALARPYLFGPFRGCVSNDGQIRGVWLGTIVIARDEATLLRFLRARADRESLVRVQGVWRAAGEAPKSASVGVVEVGEGTFPDGNPLPADSFLRFRAETASLTFVAHGYDSLEAATNFLERSRASIAPNAVVRREGILVIIESPKS